MSPPFPSLRPSSSAALKSSLISSGAQAGEGLFPCTPAGAQGQVAPAGTQPGSPTRLDGVSSGPGIPPTGAGLGWAGLGCAALSSCLMLSLSHMDKNHGTWWPEGLEPQAVGSNPSIPLTCGQIRPITPLSKPTTLLTRRVD